MNTTNRKGNTYWVRRWLMLRKWGGQQIFLTLLSPPRSLHCSFPSFLLTPHPWWYTNTHALSSSVLVCETRKNYAVHEEKHGYCTGAAFRWDAPGGKKEVRPRTASELSDLRVHEVSVQKLFRPRVKRLSCRSRLHANDGFRDWGE